MRLSSRKSLRVRGKQGHKGADCWCRKGSEGKEGAGTDKRLCFKCKKAGHLKKDCPELNKKTEEATGMFAGMVECWEVDGEEEKENLFGDAD